MSKRRDYSGLIVWASVGVLVTRYSGAFTAADVGQVSGWMSDALTAGAAVSGVGMGLLDVIGTAYIADAWRRNMPARDRKWSNRYKVLTAFLIANALEAVMILTPYTMSRIYQMGITDVLGWLPSWIWSAVVTIAPLLVVGGVIFANPGVVGVHNAEDMQASKISHAPAVVHHAEPKIVDAPTPEHQCAQCGEVFDTVQAKAAHMRWQHSNGTHKTKETIA